MEETEREIHQLYILNIYIDRERERERERGRKRERDISRDKEMGEKEGEIERGGSCYTTQA